VEPSIFLDFHLPNAATWFYFSLILTIALFFQFARPICLRNLDLLTLFLFAPGFLLLQEAHSLLALAPSPDESDPTHLLERGQRELLFAYGWLLIGSAYWFARTLFDLTLIRRPVVSPNLTTAGLACLGLALFVGQGSVAVRRVADQPEPGSVGRQPRPIEQVQDQATAVVQQAQTETGRWGSPEDVRFWVERTLAMSCHAAVVIGLVMIGLRHFQDRAAGIGMGTLYLLVPYTAYHIGQLHHVWPAAFLVWAVFCYRKPITAGWLLGLAAGSSLFPILLLPLWAGFYSRRGAGRFALAFLSAATVSVGITALVLWWAGEGGFGLSAALSLPEWQPWKVPSTETESLWTRTHWAYRMPIFVLYVGFLCSITIWPNPKNLSHLIALSAAVLIGVQFWHGDRGGVYVLWYMPLLLMMVFRPNLVMAEPPGIVPGAGLMFRLAGAAWRRVRPGPNPDKELAV
jgi:hypothetical protein